MYDSICRFEFQSEIDCKANRQTLSQIHVIRSVIYNCPKQYYNKLKHTNFV